MGSYEPVAVFWDYENCAPSGNHQGFSIVDRIRRVAFDYGSLQVFRAYSGTEPSAKTQNLRSELQSSGVSLIDCPHNGRKEVADKMIIVDMMLFAIDTTTPATIILISGDRDFVYPVSILRNRRYRVVLIAPKSAHSSLKQGASVVLDWEETVGKHAHRPSFAAADSTLADIQNELKHNASYPPATPSSRNTKRDRADSFRDVQSVLKKRNDHEYSVSVECVDERDVKLNKPDIRPYNHTSALSSSSSSGSPATPSRAVPDLRSPAFNEPVPDIGYFVAQANLVSETKRQSNRSAIISSESSSTECDPADSPPLKYGTSETSALGSTASSAEAMQETETSSKPVFPIIHNGDLPIRPATTEPVMMHSIFDDIWAAEMNTTHVTQRFEHVDSLAGPKRANLAPVARKALLVEPCSPPPAPVVVTSASDKPEVTQPTLEAAQPKLEVTQPAPQVMQPKPGVTLLNPKAAQFGPCIVATKPAAVPVVLTDALPRPKIMESKPQPTAEQTQPTVTPLIPTYFLGLLQILQKSIDEQSPYPLRSPIAVQLTTQFRGVYTKAGVARWKEYANLAEKAGFILLGGLYGEAWITLHPDWHGKVPRAES